MPIAYPYIPNSTPEAKRRMLEEVGAKSIEELYEDIPEALRFKSKLNLPEPLLSEYALKRHVEELLSRNKTCQEYLNFLGAGCYQHHVPSVCDEVNQRAEFMTAYAGRPYGSWTVPGPVQVLQPDGRTPEHGCGQCSNLRRVPGHCHRDPHGEPDHRSPPCARSEDHQPRPAVENQGL